MCLIYFLKIFHRLIKYSRTNFIIIINFVNFFRRIFNRIINFRRNDSSIITDLISFLIRILKQHISLFSGKRFIINICLVNFFRQFFHQVISFFGKNKFIISFIFFKWLFCWNIIIFIRYIYNNILIRTICIYFAWDSRFVFITFWSFSWLNYIWNYNCLTMGKIVSFYLFRWSI